MAQGVTGRLPTFNSNNEILPYLAQHRNHLTMTDITHACAWALDPGFIQRDAIAQFIFSLPRAQPHQLDEEECPLCCSPYDADSNDHFPVLLPCGHIFGADCLSEWLKKSESCIYCRAPTFHAPAAAPPLASRTSEEILRGLLQSGREFLTETLLGSGSDKSYAAFYRWAHGHGRDSESIILRLVAREMIGQLELSVISS